MPHQMHFRCRLHRECLRGSNSFFYHRRRFYRPVISLLGQYAGCRCQTHDGRLSCSAAETWSKWMKEKFTWKTVDVILTFLFLEMHTDNSTNCTLLGPVDCDSFYKWIPLNRWPGCHLIRGIAFYLLCSLFSVSLSHVHHIVYSPPPPPLSSPPLPSPPSFHKWQSR